MEEDDFYFNSLSEADDRYQIEECLGEGVYGKVYKAKDTQAGEKNVAIKIQRFTKENEPFIQEEYKVLQEFSNHPNLPEFYGIYKNTNEKKMEIWFAMELCEGGPVIDLVKGLIAKTRRMAEEHISLILREVVKAVTYLHENRILHRDIRASNILLTKDGEIKLIDFGLSRRLSSTFGKTGSCLGSPSWMAPEVINTHEDVENSDGYNNRADVWSLGITALELADGKSPFQDMHPTRAIFQIVRNPPPALHRPGNWSEDFNDFINECLVKNPEHRPYMMELLEHPFLTEVPENYYFLNQELKVLSQQYSKIGKDDRASEAVIHSNLLKKGENERLEEMQVEDLATLNELNEETVIRELKNRLAAGQSCTFIGDVLLVLNPNQQQDIYGEEQHANYRFKSRSDNAPHIYSVADSAYQAILHLESTQHILLAGESSSGKTSNYLHLVDHLLYLGQNNNINQDRIKNAIKLLHAFTHASTPINDYSTRCVFHTEIIFGNSGINTGAHFEVYQIEKWRVSSMDIDQSNFHILYYFYDGIQETGELNKYLLNNDRQYRYLRVSPDSKSNRPKDNPKQNIKKYQKILEIFKEFEFSNKQIESIFNTLAAILNLGEIRFRQKSDFEKAAEIKNEEAASRVARLLKIDEKKFLWALTNYCVVLDNRTATRKKHNCEEARDGRDVLANTLYSRIVQYVVMVINNKLSYGATIFGNKYSIKILDFYGFECVKQNHYPQFLINCANELLHYHYLQRVFGWEALETNEENLPYRPIHYYNNKDALDEMLGKSGLLNLIDFASKQGRGGKYVIEHLQDQERVFINKISGSEFCVNHYTGKVTYDSDEMPDRNRDFLPPDVIETLRHSDDAIIKSFFLTKLNKSGNLCKLFENETSKTQKQQFSQTRKMRSAGTTFKAFSIELLKALSVGGGTGGTHFVRCVRVDLQGKPRGFHKEIIKQQLRAMSVLETAKARQRGFPHRISFAEFLRRYKFMAFDFEESVEVTKENCRLLLVRLKMEGWVIGKTKVFLKYYNEEYLSRLYETQVKKIIKIQSMIRAYLAKRRMVKKLTLQQKVKQNSQNEDQKFNEDKAASVVQKAYRKYSANKIDGKLSEDKFDEDLIKFIRHFYNKWKSKSIFQVLLQYRAARFQDLYNLSQQIHLYNQTVMNILLQNSSIDLETVDSKAQVDTWLGYKKPSVLKLPFRLDEIPYFDTSHMCESLPTENAATPDADEELWDSPFKWGETSSHITSPFHQENEKELNKFKPNQLIELPYTRNPLDTIRCLASPTIDSDDEKLDEINVNYEERKDSDNLSQNSTSANRDFEYIKPPPSQKTQKCKSEYTSPIIELEMKGRRDTNPADDDPPFNFQAMLRKTNFQEDSIKREHEVARQLSFQNKKLRSVAQQKDEVKGEKADIKKGKQGEVFVDIKLKNKDNEETIKKCKTVELVSDVRTVTEISPGIVLEGVIIDL